MQKIGRNEHLPAAQPFTNREYDLKRIGNIIRRYQELRSAVEITTAKYNRTGGGSGTACAKDDIICLIVDIDRGLQVLSPRQLMVLGYLKYGYQSQEIASITGLSLITVKFHIRQAFTRMAAYLNSSRRRERWRNDETVLHIGNVGGYVSTSGFQSL